MNRFTVVETFHDYRLIDTITGREACMGDGADRIDPDWTHVVGTEKFRQAWEDEANEEAHEYFQAYFPELYELEAWRDYDLSIVFTGEQTGKYPDVLVVMDSLDMSQFSEATPGSHLGSRVHFLALPQNVQRHIAKRLKG